MEMEDLADLMLSSSGSSADDACFAETSSRRSCTHRHKVLGLAVYFGSLLSIQGCAWQCVTGGGLLLER